MSCEDWQPQLAACLGLPAGTVRVWWLDLADLPEPAWQVWPAVLDDAERARAARFVYEADRRQYVAAHAVLRAMLQRFAGLAAARWRFRTGAHGKPALDGPDAPAGLQFNISHTRGAVACAMVRGPPIGIDIEDWQRPGRHLEIAESFFAPAEVARLRAAPPAEQPRLFFRLWTLKEAYIKARGEGLAVPLDRFAFSFAPLCIAFAPGFADHAGHWQFHCRAVTDRHMLAIALRHGGANPFALIAERVTYTDIDRLMGGPGGDAGMPRLR